MLGLGGSLVAPWWVIGGSFLGSAGVLLDTARSMLCPWWVLLGTVRGGCIPHYGCDNGWLHVGTYKNLSDPKRILL